MGDVFIGYMVHGIWDGSPTPSTSASCMVWETMFLGMRDRGYGGPLSISEIFIPKNIDTVRHTLQSLYTRYPMKTSPTYPLYMVFGT